MKNFELIMPKLGESITEATILKWFVKEGDTIEEDDILLEIATDKVDSEIPSPVEGVMEKILFEQDSVVPVGSVIAIINMAGEASQDADSVVTTEKPSLSTVEDEKVVKSVEKQQVSEEALPADDRFYSPLVKNIAKKENISLKELSEIKGSGRNGRLTKNDILTYISEKKSGAPKKEVYSAVGDQSNIIRDFGVKISVSASAEDEIIEMNRIRKLTAEHMIYSKHVSAHVTNMLEVDVSSVVHWRNRVKKEFEKREGEKLTFLPVFMEAAIKALKDFPLINSSVDGDRIIIKKRINLGIAVSLPDNNLIVPVIKDADKLNLAGLTRELNRLARTARENKLKPDEIQDGTFTITNFGSFRNTIGTPIINQPQVAILAVGTIEKKPAVLETPEGDVIAIRHKMFLALTYDHRIIDGALGGAWLRKMADYLEAFDPTRNI